MEDLLHLYDKHHRHLATGVSLVLVVLLSLSIASTVSFVLEAMTPPAFNVSPVTESRTSTFDGPKVSGLDLFGKYDENANLSQVVNAPETKLNLELQGVFIAEDENLSTAIVAQKSKQGELFRIGDRLPGNVTLAAVNADHVLIKRGTVLEKLAFSDSPLRFAVGSRKAGDEGSEEGEGNDEGDASLLPGAIDPAAIPAQLPYEQAAPPSTLREALLHYRDMAARNPQAAMTELGISAVSSTEASGYRLGHQTDQPALQGVGLQSGDVVLSVNDHPVGQVKNDLALVQQLMASSHVRVEVQRGSRRFFVTVPVPQ